MLAECDDCLHYRKARPLNEAVSSLLSDGSREMGDARARLFERMEKIREQEFALLVQLDTQGFDRWPFRPEAYGYCGFGGAFLVAQKKNPHGDCVDFDVRRTQSTFQKSCHTCTFRRDAEGMTPMLDQLHRITNDLSLVGIDGARSGAGDFVTQALKELPQATFQERAQELTLVTELQGTIGHRPRHLSWCFKKSTSRNYIVCDIHNRFEDCTEWRPSVMITAVGTLINIVKSVFSRAKPTEAKSSLEYLKRRATQGDAESAYCLGWLYETGEHLEVTGHSEPCVVNRDDDEAYRWYRVAADHKHAVAAFEVASRHYDGRGIKRSLSDARYWFDRAASYGSVDAAWRLGQMYMAGIGTVKDQVKGTAFLQRAAKHGHAESQCALARNLLFTRSEDGSECEAAQWLQLAAEQNNAEALYLLSALCRSGRGVAADTGKADEYLNRAAKLGYVQAIQDLSDSQRRRLR
jgi:hypothetical protein